MSHLNFLIQGLPERHEVLLDGRQLSEAQAGLCLNLSSDGQRVSSLRARRQMFLHVLALNVAEAIEWALLQHLPAGQ